jgi:hypothetical protein
VKSCVVISVNGKGLFNMPAMSRTKQEKSKKFDLLVENMCTVKYFYIKESLILIEMETIIIYL